MVNGAKMNIEYNDKYDLLYIRFDEQSQEVVNQRINDNIVLDIGKDNKIVGIEIIDAAEVLNLSSILPVNYYLNRQESKVAV
jgi:uncharacterized protein YuzE